MKIMLIGGAGFIGLHLAAALLRNCHEVHIAGRVKMPESHSRSLPAATRFHVIANDDTDQLLKTIDMLGIDCVIGLASRLIPSSNIEDFDDEMARVILPSFRLQEQLARRGVRFAYISSGGTIYGENEKATLEETDALRPINHYGYSKMIFEQHLEFLARTQNLDYLILRPSNPFGLHQNPLREQGLIAVAVKKIQNEETIDIWGDGSVIRDYIWAEDLAKVIADLLPIKTAWGQVFNVGSGVGHSINELLVIIQELTGKTADIRYHKDRPVDAKRVVLNISKLSRTVPFAPLGLRQALNRYLYDLKISSSRIPD